MDFEWDEAKSEWNRTHRGFGFEIVYDFDWEDSTSRISSRGDELRFYTIGLHEGVPLTIIWTPRTFGNADHQRQAGTQKGGEKVWVRSNLIHISSMMRTGR